LRRLFFIRCADATPFLRRRRHAIIFSDAFASPRYARRAANHAFHAFSRHASPMPPLANNYAFRHGYLLRRRDVTMILCH